MNNFYPVWWDDTITVYNKYVDPQTKLVSWYRTVVSNVFWKYVGNKLTVGEITIESNNIVCRIPKNDKFLEKYEWVNLPNDEMKNYFTLAGGDILIKGEVDDEVDEYTSGKRSSDLLYKYKDLQGCMEVKQVSINTGAGRCDEHYLVTGE